MIQIFGHSLRPLILKGALNVISPKYRDTYLVCTLSLVWCQRKSHSMQFPFDILKSGWGEGTLLVLFIYLKQSDLVLVLIHPGSASPSLYYSSLIC